VLFDAAHEALQASSGQASRLTVVLDNLEKIERRQLVETAVLARTTELRRVRAGLVLFLHPADQTAPLSVQASQCIDLVTPPVIPVRERTAHDTLCAARTSTPCRSEASRAPRTATVVVAVLQGVDATRCILSRMQPYERAMESGGSFLRREFLRGASHGRAYLI
jgi:hypothetical protein